MEAVGWLVAPAGARVTPLAAQAVVVWDAAARAERVSLRIEYRVDGAGASRLGWVIALPRGSAEPAATVGDPALFETLADLAQPREKPLTLLQPQPRLASPLGRPFPPRPASARPPGFEPPVTPGAGQLEARLVAAGDRAAVAAWALDNGFDPAGVLTATEAAAAAGQTLVLATITPARGVLTGGITPPIALSFGAAVPALPLALAALDAAGDPDPQRHLDLTLWTLAPDRLDLALPSGAAQTVYAAALDARTARALAAELAPADAGGVGLLPRAVSGGEAVYLTRLRATLGPAELVGDHALVAAAGNAEVASGRMTAAEWVQVVALSLVLPLAWLAAGLGQAGTVGVVFGLVTLVAAMVPFTLPALRRWWPLVLALIYLSIAMPAAREAVQRSALDVPYLGVAVAVGLVVLALLHARRLTPRTR